MLVRNALLVLPIHRQTREEYYAKQGAFAATRRAKMEEISGRAFSEHPKDSRDSLERSWWWPPWKYNDVLGFLEVGSDGGRAMAGDIYLKRKHFPRHDRSGQGLGSGVPLATNHFLYYCEVTREPIEADTIESHAIAAGRIIKHAEEIVRRRIRSARVWTPAYQLSCLDMPRAIREMRAREATEA